MQRIMDFATYLNIITAFDPTAEELSPLHEIIDLYIASQITLQEFTQLLIDFKQNIKHPETFISFEEFEQSFKCTDKIFYLLLEFSFEQQNVSDSFKFEYLSLLSANEKPYFAFDDIVRYILVLAEPGDFESADEVIESTAELLLELKAVSGCVSSLSFMNFLLEEKIEAQGVKTLEVGNYELKMRHIEEILDETIEDPRVHEYIITQQELRAGALLNEKLADSLKENCRKQNLPTEGIDEFVLLYKAEICGVISGEEEQKVVDVEKGETSDFNLDKLILAAEWIDIVVGEAEDTEKAISADNEQFTDIDLKEDKEMIEMQKKLGEMRRGKSGK